MPVTIAASSSTHFLWNGNPMPRVYRVVPHGALDARLESVDDGTWMLVPLGSAVSGSEPANRDALVAALAGIVSPAVGGGGGGGGGSISPQDLADGGATAPSVQPANGSELNLLKQILDRSVGAPTWESASVTVGTTSTQLAPARPGRTTVSLNNASTSGQTITLTGGATIPPGAARDIPTTAAISGVSSAAGGVIHVVEIY